MPTIIDRYIFREITVPFMLGMAAFTSVLLMGRFLKIADLIVVKGVPAKEISLLVLYLLPNFTMVTIPMAFLLAVLLAFGRVSADSEIIAMKSCGIGILRLLAPVMVFASLAACATAFIAVYAVPWGNSSFKILLLNAVERRAEIDLRERVFFDTIPGIVIYVERYDQESQTMSGIMIQDERDPSSPLTVFAEHGALSVDPVLRQVVLKLTGGSIHKALEQTGYRHVRFDDYLLTIRLNQPGRDIGRNELDMTLDELNAGIKNPKLDINLRRDMKLELHRRFATPFACFLFALIGVPLGIRNRRSGKGAGFAVAIGLLLVYYVVLSAGRSLGEKGLVSAVIAMWAPNACFMTMGIWFFYRAYTERPIFEFTLLPGRFNRFWKFLTGHEVDR